MERLFRDMVQPVQRAIHDEFADRPVLITMGDDTFSAMTPVLAKVRPLGRPGNTVLMPLNRPRHFGPLRTLPAIDRPFGEKDDRLVWRGSTTGNFDPKAPLGSRAFVPKVAGQHPSFDIGYSQVTPRLVREGLADAVREFVKPPLSVAEQLRSKYQLALEGNELSSGLKWMLASNSVVLMPAPTVESWACEGHLRPYQHYVPVRRDLSDLRKQYAWCLDHPERCAAIAANGTAFMRSFQDEATEVSLAARVATAYASRVRLVPDAGLDPGLLVAGGVGAAAGARGGVGVLPPEVMA